MIKDFYPLLILRGCCHEQLRSIFVLHSEFCHMLPFLCSIDQFQQSLMIVTYFNKFSCYCEFFRLPKYFIVCSIHISIIATYHILLTVWIESLQHNQWLFKIWSKKGWESGSLVEWTFVYYAWDRELDTRTTKLLKQ